MKPLNNYANNCVCHISQRDSKTFPSQRQTNSYSNYYYIERDGREQAKVARNIKKARFLDYKVLEDYEWHKDICLPAHLTKEELMNLDFIQRNENLILVDSPGTGKTHLASALGRRACEKGFEVRFYRVSHLVEELETALANGRITNFRKKLEKVDLIILDEMDYLPFGKGGAELLFQIISDCYERKSLIFTSNLEFSQWNRIFTDSRQRWWIG